MRIMYLLFAASAAALLTSARPVAAQTCNERCVQQFDQQNNPIGWACRTTGSNKDCVATTTQCTITLCGGSGGTKVYTSFSAADGRLLAVQSLCNLGGSGERSLDVLMQALASTIEGEQLARGVRASRTRENNNRAVILADASP